MEPKIETVSTESDEKLSAVTFENDTAERKSEDREVLQHNSVVAAKLNQYESECKRFNVQRVTTVERCMLDCSYVIDCNLEDYGIGTLQCQIMFDAFAKNPATLLTSVSLKNNHLEYFCCHSIAMFVQMSVSLKTLTLEGCKFGDEGAIILAEGFAISISILHLNLSNCNIFDDGGEAIVKSFLINSVCQELNLSCNSLSLKTAKAFEEVLIENRTLRNLDLSHNSFYEDFAINNILAGLQQNESLENLDLSWNALCGEPFGKVLSKSIKSSKLKVLRMEHNRMQTFELKKLALGLKFSKTIEEAFVGGNSFLNGEDVNFINALNSKSPLKYLSFGKWFHLSREAFRVLKDIQLFKPFVEVIYQNVILPNPPRNVNMLDIFADRVKAVGMKPKKKIMKRDMAFFMNQLTNLQSAYLPKPDFIKKLKLFKVQLDEELIEAYTQACTDEYMRLDVHLMANHYLNRHPYTTIKLSN